MRRRFVLSTAAALIALATAAVQAGGEPPRRVDREGAKPESARVETKKDKWDRRQRVDTFKDAAQGVPPRKVEEKKVEARSPAETKADKWDSNQRRDGFNKVARETAKKPTNPDSGKSSDRGGSGSGSGSNKGNGGAAPPPGPAPKPQPKR